MTMIVIGYDRYNVIVKGFTGTKITSKKVSRSRLPSSAMITYTVKKRLTVFLSPAGMSLTKLSLDGNN
jgi:hypothetical protein